MKTFIKSSIIFVIAIVAGIFSSCDYLNVDKYFDEDFKLDSTFTQTRYVEAYMWGMVNMFPNEAATIADNNTPGPCATDEGIISMRAAWQNMNGVSFAYGLISPDNLRELNTWGTYYKIIRICNTILTRMDEAPDMTQIDRRRIESYTRFYRAYAYYNILLNFGPPILLGDEVINNNEDIAYYDRARSTYDDAVAYICSEFEAASRFMDAKQAVMDFGIPTKGAALALSARLKLIHASPVFNGGGPNGEARRYLGNWRRKTDQEPFISQTYEEKRWAVAAAAAQRLMELQDEGRNVYSLYAVDADDKTYILPTVTSDPDFNTKNFPEGALGIDHYKSYSELFNGDAPAANVKEFIWARRSFHVRDRWGQLAMPLACGGFGRLSVTQKVVDAYRMDDGRTIEEASSDGYYSEDGIIGTNKTISSICELRSTVSNMYNNREMRFYASIGFNQSLWYGLSTPTTSEAYNHVANYFNGGRDGKGYHTEELNHSITGYVIKKWVNQQDAFVNNGRQQDKVYPIIRYAEMLLSYAEALNNLTGSHQVEVNGEMRTYTRDINEIKKAFNQVRYRAGLPGITGDPGREEIQALIERERMVEFLFENRRYFDVRRWGIYEETEMAPVQGMNVFAFDASDFYQRTTVIAYGTRIVDRKMMFVPIPRNEIKRMPSLDQNPGWN